MMSSQGKQPYNTRSLVKSYRTTRSREQPNAESADKESFPFYRTGTNLRTFKQDMHYYLMMKKSCIRVATGKLLPPDVKSQSEVWYWDRHEAYNNMVERYKKVT
mmetsp:Transcript_37153/g.47354  ORF Transcript_37153/g.47354 Transcript_37153/m.47354 type:complete len:104 (-) Transcript_37153:305-616(-)